MSADAYHGTSPNPHGDGAIRSMKTALTDARLTPQDIGYINAHATSTPVGDAIEASAINSVFQQIQTNNHIISDNSRNNDSISNSNNDHHNNNTINNSNNDKENINNTSIHPRQQPLYVSSTKGATGHLLGAAGALESAFTCLTLRDQIIPPTLNLENISDTEQYASFQHVPKFAIDYKTNSIIKAEDDLKYCLSLNKHQQTLMNLSSSSTTTEITNQNNNNNNNNKLNYAMNNSFGFGGVNASIIFAQFVDK